MKREKKGGGGSRTCHDAHQRMLKLTWMTTRGDWEKYQSGRPNRLMSAVLVSYVSEQRVLRMLPP